MRVGVTRILILAALALTTLAAARSSHAQCAPMLVAPLSFAVGMTPDNPLRAVRTTTRTPPRDPRLPIPLLLQPVVISRDSQGRVRFDRTGGELHMDTGPDAGSDVEDHSITICDPVKGALIQLDTANRIATLQNLTTLPVRGVITTPSPHCRVPSNPKNSPNEVVEDLGHRIIEGFDALGWRVTAQTPVPSSNPKSTFQRIRETWCSEDLDAVLLDVISGTESGPKEEIALTEIERIEPDPSLFQIPPDYTISDKVQQQPHLRGLGISQGHPPVIR
jgi:hypothetical protein